MEWCYLLSLAAVAIALTVLALEMRTIAPKDRLAQLEQAVEDVRAVIEFMTTGHGVSPSNQVSKVDPSSTDTSGKN